MKKRSFLERLTGNIRLKDEEEEEIEEQSSSKSKRFNIYSDKKEREQEIEESEIKVEEDLDAELTIDLYQTPSDIFVQAMVAGVMPDNLNIIITRDSIIIKGKREENQSINSENYVIQELYWGSFSRTISLPEEIDPEEAEAVEKHGLLIIKLPKVDKNKETKLKVKQN